MPDAKASDKAQCAAVEDEDEVMGEDEREGEGEWEDVDEEGQDDDDEDEDEDDSDEEELGHEDVVELAMKTNALLIALFTEPQLNKTDPLQSPRPLLNTIDFVRRTYTDYILPMLPNQATQKAEQLSNPFTPQPALPNDPSILDEVNFPELDQEKYMEAEGRNMMICLSILDQDKGSIIVGGRFDFGEHVLEIAKAISSGEEGEEELTEKYAAKGVDLN